MLRIGNFELVFIEVPEIEQVGRYGIQFYVKVKDFAAVSFCITLHGLLSVLWNIVIVAISLC